MFDAVANPVGVPEPRRSGSRTLVDDKQGRSIVILELEEALCAAYWLGMGEVTRYSQLPSDWIMVG